MTALTSNGLHDLSPDHPECLLMMAHRPLSSRPAAPNGMKSIMVAAYGEYVVRLTVFAPGMIINSVAPLWLELRDTRSDRTLDGAGCNNLADAITAATVFLGEAKMLNACLNQDAP